MKEPEDPVVTEHLGTFLPIAVFSTIFFDIFFYSLKLLLRRPDITVTVVLSFNIYNPIVNDVHFYRGDQELPFS